MSQSKSDFTDGMVDAGMVNGPDKIASVTPVVNNIAAAAGTLAVTASDTHVKTLSEAIAVNAPLSAAISSPGGNEVMTLSVETGVALSNSPAYNGEFVVWQDGETFNSVANGTWLADGWRYFKTAGTLVHNATRSSDVPSQAVMNAANGYVYPSSSLRLTTVTAEAAASAAEVVQLRMVIEGYYFRAIAHRTFTLSFWVRSAVTGVHCVAFRNRILTQSYVAEYTINSADTWEYKTVVVPASSTSGWDYDNQIGMYLTWCLLAGSNVRTATDSEWISGNKLASSNQVNACSVTSGIFALALVDIQPGNVATPFLYQPYQATLARAYRYYYKFANNQGDIGLAYYATGATSVIVHAPVPMRDVPTVSGSWQLNVVTPGLAAPTITFTDVFEAAPGIYRLRRTGAINGDAQLAAAIPIDAALSARI